MIVFDFLYEQFLKPMTITVPPTMREWSGPEVEAREGAEVLLTCQARAHPPATITWRRTDALPIFEELSGKKGISYYQYQHKFFKYLNNF